MREMRLGMEVLGFETILCHFRLGNTTVLSTRFRPFLPMAFVPMKNSAGCIEESPSVHFRKVSRHEVTPDASLSSRAMKIGYRSPDRIRCRQLSSVADHARYFAVHVNAAISEEELALSAIHITMFSSDIYAGKCNFN